MMIWQSILLVIVGLAGGFVVGSGFVAFITVLDIVPRLTQLIKGFKYISWFQRALIYGAVTFTWLDFRGIVLNLPSLFSLIFGAFAGMFVGMLAAALTEVLNVLPIFAKRLNMANAILFLLMAMVLGKVTGSLFHLLVYIDK
ncbi:stage V sporulation protein AB [Vulcanibacillus modesticaldus]|uniref:Stage V sporulation protein AB n=1 Tax=Vulcanibacillus modesticaldus TaxID=337097 RepID=A0A1D2YSG8_9BACI|nr:stage V sporulation protein AB [Vulcanibacillus modesticaldus]OEF97240.1 stage V sporulation protein AB [Vulcanibacillus modesticaldus]